MFLVTFRQLFSFCQILPISKFLNIPYRVEFNYSEKSLLNMSYDLFMKERGSNIKVKRKEKGNKATSAEKKKACPVENHAVELSQK